MVRYTALATGIFYGIVHRRTLQTRENEKHAQHEIHRQEKLLEQAREAWKQKLAGPANECTSLGIRISLLCFAPCSRVIILSLSQ